MSDTKDEGATPEVAAKEEEVKKEEVKAEEPKEAPKAEPKAEKTAKEKPKADVSLSKDAEKILDMVKKLSVMDMANLVKAMEEEFGVSAAAPVAVAAAPAAGAGGDGAGGDDEPAQVNVELTEAGGQKIAVIKAVREITQVGLKDAKDLVDSAPKVIKENVPKKEADEMKAKLEEAGAKVTYK